MASRLAYLLLPLLAGFVGASAVPGVAPLHIPTVDPGSLIENQYTIILKDETPSHAFDAHVNFVGVAAQSRPLWGENGFIHVWNGGLLKGYSGRFSEDVIDMIRLRPEVKYVEQSQVVSIAEKQSQSTWGLHRISHREKIEGSDYEYLYEEGDEAGKGVMVYILDTGIRLTHQDFEGRAVWGTTIPKESPDDDDHGHGTHVAGTVAGKRWGVAKHAQLTAVKVFNASASGSSDDIIAGLEWADSDASSRALRAAEEIKATGYSSHKGSVINMSLSAGLSKALSDTAKKVYDHGHHVVAAAGNENTDACQGSPGDVPEIFTVAASTATDSRWEDSNWGDCVDIFAPGHRVTSCGIRSDTSAVTADGTSMATPHVSGVLAYLISIYPHATFEPKLTSHNALLEAYSIAYRALPPIVSCMLPTPDSFQQIEMVTVADALTPAKLKKSVMDMATWGWIDDPKSKNNALLFNNATNNNFRTRFGKDFWVDV